MDSVAEQKHAFRKKVKEISDLTFSQRQQISFEIATRIVDMEAFSQCRSIFAFIGVGNEPDTAAIIENALKQGKTVSVPLCMSDGIMQAKEIHSLSDLKPGKYGIPEPDEHFNTVRPEDIDFVLVPCVACAGDGTRLGHGKGYYDRFLPMTDALRVMISADRFVFECVPADELDCRADFVVTENECRKVEDRL